MDAYAVNTTALAHRFFTLDEGNKVIPYLRLILDDIFENFRATSNSHARLNHLKLTSPRDPQIIECQEDVLAGKAHFRRFRAEMFKVGITKIDLTRKLIELPAHHPQNTDKTIFWIWYFLRAQTITAWRDSEASVVVIEHPLEVLSGNKLISS